MGVVYYANYLIWCEVGRVEFLRARGRGYAHLEAQGVGLAVLDVSVRYLRPARFDDLIRVDTTLIEVRSRSITFDYVIRHAESGAHLAKATTSLVSIDKAGRISAIPAEVRALLSASLSCATDFG